MSNANETIIWGLVILSGCPVGLIIAKFFQWNNFDDAFRGLIVAVFALFSSAITVFMTSSPVPLIAAAVAFVLMGVFIRGVVSASGKRLK